MTGPTPDQGVYISSGQMYEEVRRVADGLIRLETKLDALRASDQDVADRLLDHETRIRRLEAGRWPLPAVAVLISVAAVVVPLLAR